MSSSIKANANLPRIAIVGKPNVGKSSLFNSCCDRAFAIVDDMPGVTRDIKEHKGQIGDLSFIIIDTAGWENIHTKDSNNNILDEKNIDATKYNDSRMKKLMMEKTKKALDSADIILFVVDGKSGISADDLEFADVIRKANKPVILIINKAEAKVKIDDNDLYKLGFDDPIYMSVAHSLGFNELYDRIQNLHKEHTDNNRTNEIEEDNSDDENAPINLAIVGRPNAGKSTLFNCLAKDDISIISDSPGTTRDSIDRLIEINSARFNIIDTAGIRKKHNIKDDNKIENAALGQSITAIRRSNVVILIMDVRNAFEKQDMAIAKIAVNEGKALILVMNKFDLVEDKTAFKEATESFMNRYFTDVYNIPVVYISAVNNTGINDLIKTIQESNNQWRTKFTTGKLNKWLQLATEKHPLPLSNKGRRIRMKYITQKSMKPPTFFLFSNVPGAIPPHYKRYLVNSFSEYFKLKGIPLRFLITKTKNPYKQE